MPHFYQPVEVPSSDWNRANRPKLRLLPDNTSFQKKKFSF
jgi:hypothetical protein